MKFILLAALAIATLPACTAINNAEASINKAWNGLSPQTQSTVLVTVTQDAAIVAADLAQNKKAAAVANDVATATLKSVAAQTQGNAGVAAVTAAGLAALKDVADKQNSKKTLSAAAVAGINAILTAPAVPTSMPAASAAGIIGAVNSPVPPAPAATP